MGTSANDNDYLDNRSKQLKMLKERNVKIIDCFGDFLPFLQIWNTPSTFVSFRIEKESRTNAYGSGILGWLVRSGPGREKIRDLVSFSGGREKTFQRAFEFMEASLPSLSPRPIIFTASSWIFAAFCHNWVFLRELTMRFTAVVMSRAAKDSVGSNWSATGINRFNGYQILIGSSQWWCLEI